MLNHVQEYAKMGDEQKRKWVCVWCDAVPYLLGSKVQEELMKCILCGQQVVTTDMDEHQESYHKEEAKEFEMWFKGIFLRPGPGHIELNMARALIKVFWHPYIQHFAILLGFRSLRAQDVIHNGVDNHSLGKYFALSSKRYQRNC